MRLATIINALSRWRVAVDLDGVGAVIGPKGYRIAEVDGGWRCTGPRGYGRWVTERSVDEVAARLYVEQCGQASWGQKGPPEARRAARLRVGAERLREDQIGRI